MKNKIKKENKFVKSLYNKKIIIPEEWEIKKIEDSCNILDYKRIPINSNERKKIQGNYPYYDANGIQDYVNDYIFDEELILLAEDGGCFEEYETRPIAQYVDKKCWVNNHAHVLTAKNNNFLKWIFYSLIHKNIIPYINGSTRAKLNQYDLKQIKIFIPPPLEQQKIASILSNVDALIESTQKIIERTERLKKGLMQQLLTRGIGHKKFKKIILNPRFIEIIMPKDWTVKPIFKILKITMGQSPPSESYNQEEQGLPFYQGVTDFGTMHPNPTIWCTESKKTAQKNSILLSVRAPVGEINLTVTECCLGRGVAALYTLDNNLIYCYYLITQNKKRFLPYSQGTTYDAINSSEIANIRLAHTTNIVEQQKIASILSGVDAYIQINQEYKEKLERLKKGLMQNLLTGKIRVKT